MSKKKVALVTGGSSGIGLATAKSLSEKGVTVYELSRRESKNIGITHLSGDVTNERTITSAINEIIAREGRLDILVTAAGYGISGAVEFTPEEDSKKQLDVNFFGTVNAVHAALPIMRKQNTGRIVCISSVAGAIPIPFQTFYSVSKAAINAFTTALRSEVRPYGITVCSILPGDIQTGFTDARMKIHTGDEEYGGRISRSVSSMEKDERGGMKPETAGNYIAKIALKNNVRPLYSIGLQYKLFVWLARVLPGAFTSRLIGHMYAK